MATFNKTMTLTMAIVFLTIVRATSYNTSSIAKSLNWSDVLCWTNVNIFRYVPLVSVAFLFGIIGNSLSFAVLHIYSSGNVGAYLLKALAVTDTIFLATMLLVIINGITELVVIRIIVQVFIVLAWATMTWTVWMIVIVAGNRYIAVCCPMLASRLCTINKVRLEIILVGALCVLIILICFYLSDSIILFQCLFVFLFPLALLIFFNVKLIRSLQLAHRSRMVMTSRSSNDGNNITIVMIVIIIVFFVCQAPLLIFMLIDSLTFYYYLSCKYTFFLM